MLVTALVEMIERAFVGVRRDPEQSLHQAQLTDQGIAREITEQEWKASALLDLDEEWHEVPVEDLCDCDSALSHLTPISWRYYLPSYMRAALEFLGAPLWEADLPHHVLHTLTYDDTYPGMGQYYLERFEVLSESQFATVRAFLEFVRDKAEGQNSYAEQAEEALRSYWGLSDRERPNKSLQPTAASGGR